MRIALVWVVPTRLTTISVRYERYVRGFERLGHEVVTVCPEQAAEGYPFSVRTCTRADELERPEFWRGVKADAALVITWLQVPRVVEAMKAHCPFVVSIADSDGLAGVRVYPGFNLWKMLSYHASGWKKLAAFKYWIQLFIYKYRRQDLPILESAKAADRIIVGSPGAQKNLRAFFDWYHRPELAEKVAVAPYPVDACYLDGQVQTERIDRMVSIGRWDDPQKDAGLLRAAIRLALKRLPGSEFVIVGPGGEPFFAPLCRESKRVRYLGVQTPDEIAKLLRASRALLLTSRWESGPIVAHEALSLGCSLIGPRAIPSFDWFCSSGPYGTVFERRSAAHVADAISAEMTAWNRQERNPIDMAARWRPVFDARNVCAEMLK